MTDLTEALKIRFTKMNEPERYLWEENGTPVIITYSFLSGSPVTLPSYYGTGAHEMDFSANFGALEALNSGQETVINDILDVTPSDDYRVLFSDVVVMGFSNSPMSGAGPTSHGQITFSKAEGDIAGGTIMLDDDDTSFSEDKAGIVFNNSNKYGKINIDDTDILEYGHKGFSVMVHEISHALGLKDIESDTSFVGFSDGYYYSNKYSIMSYTTLYGSMYAYTLQLLDIYALQERYESRNYETRDENGNIYSLGHGFLSEKTTPFLYTIWDGGGDGDTINASGYEVHAQIDLRQGHFSSIGTRDGTNAVYFDNEGTEERISLVSDNFDHGNVAIAYYTVIENAVGTHYDDILIGNAWDNFLDGGDGNDELYGDGYVYDEDTGFLGDTDALRGGAAWTHSASDGSGRDTLDGGAGDDYMNGGAGGDTYKFYTWSTGEDTIEDDGEGGAHDTIDIQLADYISWNAGALDVYRWIEGDLVKDNTIHFDPEEIENISFSGAPLLTESLIDWLENQYGPVQDEYGYNPLASYSLAKPPGIFASVFDLFDAVDGGMTLDVYDDLLEENVQVDLPPIGTGTVTVALDEEQNITEMTIDPGKMEIGGVHGGTGTGSHAPVTLAVETYNPAVMTMYDWEGDTLQMEFWAYVKNIGFLPGIAPGDVRLSVDGSVGHAALTVHVDSEDTSFVVPDFEAGFNIVGIAKYDFTVHNQIMVQNDTIVFSTAPGEWLMVLDADVIYTPGIVNETFFLNTFRFADSTVWDVYNDPVTFRGADAGYETIYGMDTRGDILIGGIGGNNGLYAYGGNDELRVTGAGDYLSGGDGDDTYVFDAEYGGGAYIFEDEDEGTDQIVLHGIDKGDVKLAANDNYGAARLRLVA